MNKTIPTQNNMQPVHFLYSFLPLIFSALVILSTLDKIKPASAFSPGFGNAENAAFNIQTVTPTATITATQTATHTPTQTPIPTATATPIPPERSQLRYSDTVTNLDVLFASHIIANRPKAANEYRVVLIGDSGTWEDYMPSSETLAGRINAAGLQTCNSRTVKVYNMALRATSLVKDLVFIDKVMEYEPDLVLWFLTLNTFRPESQLSGKNFLPKNRVYIQNLSNRYDLGLNPASLSVNTQTEDQAWEIIRASEEPPHVDSYPALPNDQTTNINFTKILNPPTIMTSELPFKLFYAGLRILYRTKVLVINEPIFIANGKNSNLRYNQYYPRWVYDQYRSILLKQSIDHGWNYLDLWNAIPSPNFTGTALHRTPNGDLLMFKKMAPIIKQFPCRTLMETKKQSEE